MPETTTKSEAVIKTEPPEDEETTVPDTMILAVLKEYREWGIDEVKTKQVANEAGFKSIETESFAVRCCLQRKSLRPVHCYFSLG